MFLWPTTTKRITSNYGYRTHPITGRRTLHPGVDIAEPGTHEIYAAASGTVTRSYRSDSYGECVFILHKINGITYETVYAHMRGGSRRVNVNQKVRKGQTIGFMGNTGNSTGQHLHFEVHKGRWNISKSNSVDPMKYLSRKDKTIEQLQKDLKKLGYDVGQIDGLNGNKTKQAIKTFQRDENLTIDGIAGKQTLAKISDILKGGLTMSQYKKLNNRIKKLERQLKESNKQKASSVHAENFKKASELGLMNDSDPFKSVTREQLATVMVRLIDRFIQNESDAEEYAVEALDWVKEHGISTGDNPAHVATRQQVITMIYDAINLAVSDNVKKVESVEENGK